MINKLLEYITMKWLLDGWKYITGLVIAVLAGYIAYPYVVLWLYEKGYKVFSWEILVLGIIIGATLMSVCIMFYNAAVVEPRAGKTDFSKRK